jgi:lysophospholipase L1-like esterase
MPAVPSFVAMRNGARRSAAAPFAERLPTAVVTARKRHRWFAFLRTAHYEAASMRAVWVASMMLAFACSTPAVPGPGGDVPQDASVLEHDASVPDAGAPDSGSPDAGEPDAGPADAGAADAGAADAGLSWAQRCKRDLGSLQVPDYLQFNPRFAEGHCDGTNAQDIAGIERVVFLGDSVTVGTPPTLSADYYRALLAGRLATRFGLTAPDPLWRLSNALTGQSALKTSGDFSSCAEWGARIDDLLGGDRQLESCFGAVEAKRTLVVMTLGGNDFAAWAKEGMAGTSKQDILVKVDAAMAQLSAALDWLKDPVRFPNGSAIVLSDVYEYTDGTRDTQACPTASLAGYTKAWPDGVEVFARLNEGVVRAAVQHGIDVVFMAQGFCGHGFKRDDPAAPCYLGPNTPGWFDPATCVHPNTAGHLQLAGMFERVIAE